MSLEYLGNCSYPVDYVDMSLGEQLVMSSYASDVIFGIYACTPFKWQYLVMLVAVMMWIIIGRWYYDLFMRFRTQGAAKSFSLAEALTKEDNKALSIDFACFLFSLCWITRGSMMDLPAGNDDARYFGGFFTYQLLGYVLLAIARVINDKLVLRAVDNSGEMVEKKNLGVACAQGGATIGTAIIIAAAAGGVAIDFAEGIATTLLYWLLGQLMLILYCTSADCITSVPAVQSMTAKLVKREISSTESEPNDPPEIMRQVSENGPTSLLKQAAKGNVAAGLTLGVDMIAASIIIATPVIVGYSIVAWLIFVSFSLCLVAPLLYLYLDHIVMRGASITISILRHKNWGAAVLLGALKLLTALMLQSLYRYNCDVSKGQAYADCYDPPEGTDVPFWDKFTAVTVPYIFNWQSLLDALLLLLVMLVAKGVYFLRFKMKPGAADFSLDEALADPQNNAIAVSLAAYAFAQGLALVGAAYCPNEDAGVHGVNIAVWTLVGCALLFLAFLINDLILLHSVDNTLQLREDNVAIALFEGGSFISCGLILRSNLLGSGGDETAEDYARGLALVGIYWLVCQAILLLFAYLYRLITSFDDHAELVAGNASAGLSGGLTLVALAVVMSYPLVYYSSLLIFLPIAIIGVIALVILRVVVDMFVLPGDRLDNEIKGDHNWGAALIEGAVAIGFAFVGNLYVPPPGDPNTYDLVCPTSDY